MLTYIGNGAALFDVPARDLTKDEIQALSPEVGLAVLVSQLKKSGLYQAAEASPDSPQKDDTKGKSKQG